MAGAKTGEARAVSARARNKAKFNPSTRQSERLPFVENIVHTRVLGRTWARIRSGAYYRITFGLSKPTLENGAEAFGLSAADDVLARIPEKYLETMRQLRDGSLTQGKSYLVFRWLPLTGFFFPWPREDRFPERIEDVLKFGTIDSDANRRIMDEANTARERLDRKFRNTDWYIAGLLYLLGAKIDQRFRGIGPFARNMLLDPGEGQVGDLDLHDVAMRFHQSTVEKVLPSRTDSRAGDEACRYRVFLCIKNKIRIPIYILTVHEIINSYLCPDDPVRREKMLEILQEERFVHLGPISGWTEVRTRQIGPVLAKDVNYDGDWIMSFDPERVSADGDDAEARIAIRELRLAVNRAQRDAILIRLTRGDVLVVDNLRAMISRREFYPSRAIDFLRLMMFRPRRWMRMYYAFDILDRRGYKDYLTPKK